MHAKILCPTVTELKETMIIIMIIIVCKQFSWLLKKVIFAYKFVKRVVEK